MPKAIEGTLYSLAFNLHSSRARWLEIWQEVEWTGIYRRFRTILARGVYVCKHQQMQRWLENSNSPINRYNSDSKGQVPLVALTGCNLSRLEWGLISSKLILNSTSGVTKSKVTNTSRHWLSMTKLQVVVLLQQLQQNWQASRASESHSRLMAILLSTGSLRYRLVPLKRRKNSSVTVQTIDKLWMQLLVQM